MNAYTNMTITTPPITAVDSVITAAARITALKKYFFENSDRANPRSNQIDHRKYTFGTPLPIDFTPIYPRRFSIENEVAKIPTLGKKNMTKNVVITMIAAKNETRKKALSKKSAPTLLPTTKSDKKAKKLTSENA